MPRPGYNDPYETRSLPVRTMHAAMRSVRSPAVGVELARHFFVRKFMSKGHYARVAGYRSAVVTVQVAVNQAPGVSMDEINRIMQEPELLATQREVHARADSLMVRRMSRAGYAELCYLMCRILKPEVAVETGVGFGWCTAFILRAMEVNGRGRLHSVELQSLGTESGRQTGVAVPERLRPMWTLHLGPQRRVLPKVLANIPAADFVHYDSDKTYQGMIETYRLLWPKLSARGVLMSDDLDNDAFADFAGEVKRKPLVVRKQRDGQLVGLMSKGQE